MATSVIAAAVARAEREIVEHFRHAGATSAGAAAAPPDLRPVGRRRLQRLVDAQVLRPAAGGFYLDEAIYASYRSDRRAAVIGVAVALVGVVVAVLLAQNA